MKNTIKMSNPLSLSLPWLLPLMLIILWQTAIMAG